MNLQVAPLSIRYTIIQDAVFYLPQTLCLDPQLSPNIPSLPIIKDHEGSIQGPLKGPRKKKSLNPNP